MRVKVIQDGDRVVVTFTGIENPELFLERVVEIVSTCSEDEVIPQEALGLVPPANEEYEESYVENEDFEAPFTGKTPEEILDAPHFEGFYFLCHAIIPSQYKDECNRLLFDFAEKRKVFSPPYGETKRMQNYLMMARKILGDDAVPDTTSADDEMLDIICEGVSEKIHAFFVSKTK